MRKDVNGKDGKDGFGGQHQRGVAYTLLTENNADFAQSLLEAFEREGRAVSQELVALSQKSKRYGGGREKHSKVGLGFGAGSAPTGIGIIQNSSNQHHKRDNVHSAGTDYYGPSLNPHITKRSRWS